MSLIIGKVLPPDLALRALGDPTDGRGMIEVKYWLFPLPEALCRPSAARRSGAHSAARDFLGGKTCGQLPSARVYTAKL